MKFNLVKAQETYSITTANSNHFQNYINSVDWDKKGLTEDNTFYFVQGDLYLEVETFDFNDSSRPFVSCDDYDCEITGTTINWFRCVA